MKKLSGGAVIAGMLAGEGVETVFGIVDGLAQLASQPLFMRKADSLFKFDKMLERRAVLIDDFGGVVGLLPIEALLLEKHRQPFQIREQRIGVIAELLSVFQILPGQEILFIAPQHQHARFRRLGQGFGTFDPFHRIK